MSEAKRYWVQVFHKDKDMAVFDDDVVDYSTDDPVWFSLTTIFEGDRTVWLYPVSQITAVCISELDA